MGAPAWRVLPVEVGDPRSLMAGSDALLASLTHAPAPTLRWYRSTHTAIVRGRSQAGLVLDGALPVVSRSTGGGAVLLTPDLLSLDVALPAGHPLLEGDLTSVFLPVGRAWRDALASMGVRDLRVHEGPATATRRGSPRQRLLADICYGTRGRGEVLVGERKLVGLAQRRRRAGALIQCGLLRRWTPGPLLAALGADPDDAELAAAAVGLDDLLEDPPDDDTVARVVSARLTR